MAMIEKNMTSRSWLEKAPSPTGSEDSGLGWSPPGAGDCLFRLENTEKLSNNYFTYSESESTCSPLGQDPYKPWMDLDVNCKADGSQVDFPAFTIDQKPVADILDGFWDQKPLVSSVGQQQNKKALNKAAGKKKQVVGDNSPSSKLERCFQPKTGNGKPRQTSVKRKPSPKNTTAYPYPGVRVLTVREKLKKMRQCRDRSQPSSPSPSCAYTDNNQAIGQTVPQSQFQQNFNQAVQQQQALQGAFSPSPTQSPPVHTSTSLENTSPLHHISYAPPSIGSNFSFDLDASEAPDSYPQSLSSASPSHSSHCSSPQQYPSSPEMSPNTQAIFPPAVQCKEIQQPLNYPCSMQQMSNFRTGFEMEQNYPSLPYEPKVQVQNSFEIDDSVSPYDNTCTQNPQLFSVPNQYNFQYDAATQVFQSVQRGDIQLLRKLLFKREYLNVRDEAGKFPLFVAIECSQLEVMKFLLSLQPNCLLKTFDGRTVLHAAAACHKSDVMLHLLNSMHRKDVVELINKKTLKSGCSALHLAAKGKLINNMIQLLRYGANFLLQDNCGYAPLHIAIKNSDVMSVRALIQVANDNQKTRELTCQRTVKLNTPLHVAAEMCNAPENCKQQLDIIKLLIGSNADPGALNFARAPPKDLLPPLNTSRQVLEAHYLMGGTGVKASPVNVLQHQMVFPHSNLLNGVVCPHSQ